MLFKRNVFAVLLLLYLGVCFPFLKSHAQAKGPGRAETMEYVRGKFLSTLKNSATTNIDIDTITSTMKIYSTHSYGRVIFIHFNAIDDNFTQWIENDNTVFLELHAKSGFRVAEVADFKTDGTEESDELRDNIILEFEVPVNASLPVNANYVAVNNKDDDRKKKHSKKLADTTAKTTTLPGGPPNSSNDVAENYPVTNPIQGFEMKIGKAISHLVFLCGGKVAGQDPFADR